MYRLFWEPFCKAGNAFEHIQHVSMDRLCMREQQMEHYARFIMHAVITDFMALNIGWNETNKPEHEPGI